MGVHHRVAPDVVRFADRQPVDVAHADFGFADVAGFHALVAQLDGKSDRRVVAAAARIGLEAVFRDTPVAAEFIGDQFGFYFIALIQREQAGVAFERAARAGQPVGGEKGAEHRRARGEARAEPF